MPDCVISTVAADGMAPSVARTSCLFRKLPSLLNLSWFHLPRAAQFVLAKGDRVTISFQHWDCYRHLIICFSSLRIQVCCEDWGTTVIIFCLYSNESSFIVSLTTFHLYTSPDVVTWSLSTILCQMLSIPKKFRHLNHLLWFDDNYNSVQFILG